VLSADGVDRHLVSSEQQLSNMRGVSSLCFSLELSSELWNSGTVLLVTCFLAAATSIHLHLSRVSVLSLSLSCVCALSLLNS
jgi:hypothetical protein